MAETLDDRIEALLSRAVAIDCRDPTFLLYRFTGDDKPAYFDVCAQSGITLSVVDAAWVDSEFAEAVEEIGAWHARCLARRDRVCVVRTVEEAHAAKRTGRHGFILSLQSPNPIGTRLERLPALAALGIRMIQITYQTRTYLGDGASESPDGGLSRLGRRALEAMRDVGITVDLSHAGHRTAREALEHVTFPVVFSHSNVAAVWSHPRNLPDDVIEALAANGGVIGVSAYSAFLRERGGETGTTLADYLRHVDYLVQRVGWQHVGIGFDVGEFRTPQEVELIHGRISGAGHAPASRYVTELQSRTGFRHLVAELLAQGYSEEALLGILGGNFMRVFQETWKPLA